MTNAKLSPAFEAVLKSERIELNARFAQAKRAFPALEGEPFFAFLTHSADPVVKAVAALRPELATDVARAVYGIGLELVGQKLAGPNARAPWVDIAWQRVLPGMAAHLAENPHRVAASLSNAAHMLASRGARTDRWLEAMEKLGPHAPGADAALVLGQVLAWRCGLAHFRDSALAASDRLPPALALSAVGAKQTDDWPATRARLLAEPWFHPGRDAVKGESAAQAGGFRGFGGPFVEPPRVAATESQLFVSSADQYWLLCADAFGATFHGVLEADYRAGKSESPPRGLRVPEAMGKVTSAARTRTTVALTCEHTHMVQLFPA